MPDPFSGAENGHCEVTHRAAKEESFLAVMESREDIQAAVDSRNTRERADTAESSLAAVDTLYVVVMEKRNAWAGEHELASGFAMRRDLEKRNTVIDRSCVLSVPFIAFFKRKA